MINTDTLNFAQYIDHTMLKPYATNEDIYALIDEAIKYNFCSVCIPPYYVPIARKRLVGSRVKLVTVAGFPLGFNLTSNKTEMVLRCADVGAQEIDVVLNIAAVKSGDFDFVSEDLESISTAANIKGVLLKVILETCYLTLEEIRTVCNLCVKNEVPFIKTSTGLGTHGATVEHVKFIKSVVGDKAKIKASGGIKTYADAVKMIEAGAERIGTSSGVSIINSIKS